MVGLTASPRAAGQPATVPVAFVDLRAGGTIRTHYDPNARIGDPQTTRSAS